MDARRCLPVRKSWWDMIRNVSPRLRRGPGGDRTGGRHSYAGRAGPASNPAAGKSTHISPRPPAGATAGGMDSGISYLELDTVPDAMHGNHVNGQSSRFALEEDRQ